MEYPITMTEIPTNLLKIAEFCNNVWCSSLKEDDIQNISNLITEISQNKHKPPILRTVLERASTIIEHRKPNFDKIIQENLNDVKPLEIAQKPKENSSEQILEKKNKAIEAITAKDFEKLKEIAADIDFPFKVEDDESSSILKIASEIDDNQQIISFISDFGDKERENAILSGNIDVIKRIENDGYSFKQYLPFSIEVNQNKISDYILQKYPQKIDAKQCLESFNIQAFCYCVNNNFVDDSIFELIFDSHFFELSDFILEKTDLKIPVNLLIKYIKTEEKEMIDYILNKRIDLNSANEENETPLIAAIKKDDVDLVNLLISKGSDVNLVVNDVCPFTACVDMNSMKMIKLLEKKGLKVKNSLKKPILIYAIEKNAETIVNYFLSKNMSVFVSDQNGRFPLYYALESGNIKIVKSLLDKKANLNQVDKSGTNGLFVAKDFDIFSLLIEKGADVNALNKEKMPILIHSIQNLQGKFSILLINKNADFEKQFRNKTAIVHAIEQKQRDVVKLLLEKECKLPERIFTNALESLDYEIIKLVVEKGVKTDYQQKKLPILYGIESQSLELCKFLVERGFEINGTFSKKPVSFFAFNSKNPEITKYLVSKGLDLNSYFEPQNIYLIHYIITKCNSKIGLALEKYIDLSVVDGNGKSPLILAIDNKLSREIIEKLINKNHDLVNMNDKEGKYPLYYALKYINSDVIKLLLENGVNPNTTQYDNQDIIFYLIKKNVSVELIKLFIDHGLEFHQSDKNGKKALHHAIKIKNKDIIGFLVDNGCFNDFGVKYEEKIASLFQIPDSHDEGLSIFFDYIVQNHIETSFFKNDLFNFAFKSKNLRFLKILAEKFEAIEASLKKELIKYVETTTKYDETYIELLEFMLEHIENKGIRDESGKPILLIAIEKSIPIKLFEFLIKKGVSMDDHFNLYPIIFHAIKMNKEEYYKLMITNKCKLERNQSNYLKITPDKNEPMNAAYIYAIETKDTDLLSFLKSYNFKIDTYQIIYDSITYDFSDEVKYLNKFNYPPENFIELFRYAIYMKNITIIDYFLDVSINKYHLSVYSFFAEAMRIKDKDLVYKLYQARKKIFESKQQKSLENKTIFRNEDEKPFMFYVYEFMTKKFATFFKNLGIDFNAVDKLGRNCLMYAIDKSADSEIIKKLVKYGIDVNIKAKNGKTPLMFAISNSMKAVKELADENDITRKTNIINKNFEIMKILIENGADINYKYFPTPKKQVDGKYGKKPNQRQKETEKKEQVIENFRTPIFYALRIGRVDIVSYFIEKGANLTIQSGYGNLLVLNALESAKYKLKEESILEIVKLLFEKGAMDKKSNKSITNLMGKCRDLGFNEIEDFLVTMRPKMRKKTNKQNSTNNKFFAPQRKPNKTTYNDERKKELPHKSTKPKNEEIIIMDDVPFIYEFSDDDGDEMYGDECF
ncbi:hypothetical protein TVAG_421090 [Trichomonas vaginalis G3]|uniref:DUF3447 domain-containing protein n=1 Tax=Trichomonas vaginalis (strain ATCC PRA-98 / G3) TaxID=412133 RepID=A2EVT4_TRIV3|nr:ankyrin repeat-containing family [Trichomonas vaginalis G3]EAY03221.1 hypothetical protein TVAG_421090 [Trichomonas vaginalis G3]KAI5550819.1 ankyrin repeat-containing family [Trichomonas vaginalis G3]|eukprot:XP_001315444.1 hypothetical protein [Trichomonas vaginalis G3]